MHTGNLFSRLWRAFAPAPDAPLSAEGKVPAALMRDAVYSESLIYSGVDWPKYNPDDLLRGKGNPVYRKMMMDEQVKAVVRFKRDAVTARQWYFDTKANAPKEEADEEQQPGAVPDEEQPEGTPAPAPKLAARRAAFRRDFLAPAPNEAPGAGGPGGAKGPEDVGSVPGAETEGPEVEEEKSEEELELERRAAILTEALEKMDGSLRDGLNGIMTSMYNGFSMTEKVFKHFEFQGKTWVGVKHLRLKPFHSFQFYVDEYGNIEQVVQRWESQQETPIALDKFIHHVHNPDIDMHYGCSELRDCYRAWFSKDMVIRFMNIYLERMGGGFVVVSVKDGAQNPGTAEQEKVKTLLQTLSAKTGLLLPAGLEAEVTYPGNTDAHERAIAIYDKAIAKALLVPNLLGITEQGDTGSYSQSQTQLEAFLWTLDSEAARLEDTLNKQLIQPLCDINFGDGGPYPLFKFEPISDTVKMGIIKLWNEMVKAGSVKATDADEAHLRELLDFPEAGEPLSAPPPALVPGLPGDVPAAPGNSSPAAGAKPAKPGARPVGKAPPPDQTIVGRGQMKSSRAFARAVKRVDFAVIDNRGAQVTSEASLRLIEVLKEASSEILAFVREADMFKNPDKIAAVKVPARAMTRARRVVEAALKEAWGVGAQHARNELNRARGPVFAADTLRLQDEAAQRFLESRSYTVAGDLADNLRKKVVNVLYNGIKGGWALTEIENRIEEEIGAAVLPHAGTAIRTTVFEAINEARYELFASPEMENFVEALEYSAILDGKTTEVCEHMDGRTYAVGDAIWERYTPPLHFNCRSLLVAVIVRDPWDRSPDPSIDPQDGFGG